MLFRSDRARAVDALIRDAWARCVPGDARLALFAVGGYGRGELFPHSDIDLLVLAADAEQHARRDALACFFALLWDIGLEASHALRSPAQCTQAAADPTVRTVLPESLPLVAAIPARHPLACSIATATGWGRVEVHSRA